MRQLALGVRTQTQTQAQTLISIPRPTRQGQRPAEVGAAGGEHVQRRRRRWRAERQRDVEQRACEHAHFCSFTLCQFEDIHVIYVIGATMIT